MIHSSRTRRRRGARARAAAGGLRTVWPALLLLLPCSAAAQGRQGGGEGEGNRSRQQNAWAFSLALAETYNSNITYRQGDGLRALVTRVSGGVARSQNLGQRMSLRAAAQAATLMHGGNVSDLNRGTYAGNLSAGSPLWKGATFNVAAQAAYTYSNDEQDLGELLDPTIQLRLASTRRTAVSLGGAQKIGRRSGMNVHGSYRSTTFLDAPDLLGGRVYATSTNFSTGFGRVGALTLGYGYSHSSNRRADADVHSGTIGYGRPLGRNMNISASVGASRVETQGQAPISGIGEASLSYTPQTGRFNLRVSRNVSQAVGLGRERVADRARLSYSRPFSREVSWSLGASYSISRDPVDPTFKNTTQGGSTSLSYIVSRNFSLAGGYTFVRSDPGTGPVILSHSASVALSYHVALR